MILKICDFMNRQSSNPILAFAIFFILILILTNTLFAQRLPVYEEPPIFYSKTETSNHADWLALAIRAFPERQLPTKDRDALMHLLKAFALPVETQVLVFSKTSLQRAIIHPKNPRAIYYSEDAYLGFVPNGIFELALHDAQLGLVFYEIRPKTQSIQRSQDCLNCHAGSRTDHWPGVFIRSVYPQSDGNPILSKGSFLTTHQSPISERWGGWYVSGQHGSARHLGNLIFDNFKNPNSQNDHPDFEMDSNKAANGDSLESFFDLTKYPISTSDIVSLMVLEHQCEMHNRLSRGMLRTRKWMAYQSEMDKSLGKSPSEKPIGTARSVVRGEAARIVDCLLFYREARLPAEGISGNRAFQSAFRHNRREDSLGRSLKDFDLRDRLFTYRCSYMIYSKAFDTLPKVLKNTIFTKLVSILKSPAEGRYAYLPQSERKAILKILIQTKPEIHRFL